MVLWFLCTQTTFAQNIGGVPIPFDPLKLLPKTGTEVADSVQKRVIEIVHSDLLIQETDTTTNTIKRILNGRVKLIHDGAIMTCDSAILFPQSNYLEAKGKVKIIKGDSVDVRADILRYSGDTKVAILENNVQLRDHGSVLTAPMMTYEVDNEIGHFWNNGKLVSDSTTLTSQSGTSYQKEGFAVFRRDVVLVSPDYTMTADSMKYHSESKIAYFITTTTIVSGTDTIITNDGYFDTEKNKAYLKGRPLIKNGTENTLQSDFLDYDKSTGIGVATGQVISRNTKEKANLLSNYIYYVDSNKYTLATQNPLLIQEDKKDTLYLSADTLINYSVPKSEFLYKDSLAKSLITSDLMIIDSLVNDSLQISKTIKDSINHIVPADTNTLKEISSLIDTLQSIEDSNISIELILKDSISTETKSITDSTLVLPPDSLLKENKEDSVKIFYGYKDVKLIRTNLSGICDSIYFNSQDSIFRLFYNPILWMDSTQLKADSIYIFMKNEEAERIELYNNAIIVNESTAGVYNQIAGKKITGWLIDNELRHVLVDGNAECIYFLKNDSNQYLGGNQAKSALINISFNEKSEIERIKLEISPEAVFTPMQQVEYSTYKLPNFDWYWTLKPKSKWDVIRDTLQYQQYISEYPIPIDSNAVQDSTEVENVPLESTEDVILESNPEENESKKESDPNTEAITPTQPSTPREKFKKLKSSNKVE